MQKRWEDGVRKDEDVSESYVAGNLLHVRRWAVMILYIVVIR